MPTKPTDPFLVQQAHDAMAKHGSPSAAARALGIARSTLQGRLQQQPMESGRIGRSIDELYTLHDPAKRIASAIGMLEDGWLYEIDFIRAAGINAADLGQHRDKFKDHWATVDRTGKRAWFGSKDACAKFKKHTDYLVVRA